MELNNATPQEAEDSGAQAGAVDQQESYSTDYESDDFVDVSDDSQAGAVDRQENAEGDVSEDDDEEPSGEDSSEDPDDADQDAGKQNRTDNQAARNARLRARREYEKQLEKAKADAQAEADRRIRESGVINPYTKKPFSSFKEFEEYGARVKEAELEEEAKASGKTVEQLREERENAAFIADLRRKKSEEEKAEQDKASRAAFIKKDLIDFMDSHPDVDVEKLDNNTSFRAFCGSRYGREPLSDLYDDYVALVGKAERVAGERKSSKAARSTGAGSPGGESLSPEEKKRLNEWNSQYPELAMTPKEFLAR